MPTSTQTSGPADIHYCRNAGCASAIPLSSDYCPGCVEQLTEYERDATLSGQQEEFMSQYVIKADTFELRDSHGNTLLRAGEEPKDSMAARYPQYYKDVTGYSEIDVYAVHKLFAIDDPSGAIQHASKKLLLSGNRTGGKPKHKDIKEARDTLTRWLALYGHA